MPLNVRTSVGIDRIESRYLVEWRFPIDHGNHCLKRLNVELDWLINAPCRMLMVAWDNNRIVRSTLLDRFGRFGLMFVVESIELMIDNRCSCIVMLRNWWFPRQFYENDWFAWGNVFYNVDMVRFRVRFGRDLFVDRKCRLGICRLCLSIDHKHD